MGKHTFSRRAFLRVAASGAALTGLTACVAPSGTVAPVTGDAAAPAAAKKQLEFWGTSSENWGAVLKEFLDQIEQETGIHVEYLRAPGGWAEQTQRLNSAIAAAAVPDFAHVKDFSLWDYAWRGALLALDDMYATIDFDKSALRPSVWSSMHYKDSLYGAPWKGSFVWYSWTNDDRLAEIGLDPQADAPKTWNELVEVAKATTDESQGRYGHVFYELATREVNLMLFSVYVGQAGGNIFNEDRTQLTLDSEACHTALQWMYDMLWTWKVALPPDQMTSRWDMVYSGAISTWMTGSWFVSEGGANAPGLNFSIHQWPCNVTCDNADTPEAMVIFKDARDPETSWEAITHLIDPAVDLRLAAPDIGGYLPAYVENLSKFYTQSGTPESQKIYQQAAEIALASPLRPRYWVEGYEDVVAAVMPEIEAVWFDQKNVADGLASAQAAGTDALQRAKQA